MILRHAIDALVRFEEQVASFYIWLATELQRDGEVASLFILLAEQEQGHAEILREVSRSLGEQATRSIGVDVAAAVDEGMVQIETFRASIASPSAFEALTFTLKLEDGGAERLGRDRLLAIAPEVEHTLRALDEEDARHASLMRELLASRSG